MKTKIIIGLISGALLGIVCIIGANIRFGSELTDGYLFAFWYNRVILGFVTGLYPLTRSKWFRLTRGVVSGLAISFMFYSATAYLDIVGFLAGGVYGFIIAFVIEYWEIYRKGEEQL